MKLLTKAVLRHLPPLYAQESVPDPIVHVKFFTPDSSWTWYATEGSSEGSDFIFFGYVVGAFPEWGYFSLSELQSVRGNLGLPIELDLHFRPRAFSQITEAACSNRGGPLLLPSLFFAHKAYTSRSPLPSHT